MQLLITSAKVMKIVVCSNMRSWLTDHQKKLLITFIIQYTFWNYLRQG